MIIREADDIIRDAERQEMNDVRWAYDFTDKQKAQFKQMVPRESWNNIFIQRMYYIDKKGFKRLARSKLDRVVERGGLLDIFDDE